MLNNSKKLPLERIIISRTDAIGDVVLTLPICGLIKKHYPNSKIYFLGKSYTKPVIDCCEYVDEFINADTLLAGSDQDALEVLKKINADAIVHVFPHRRIAALAKAAHIKWRVGTINRLFHWGTINKFVFLSRKKSKLHESQLNCKLLEGIGISEIPEVEKMHQYVGFSKIGHLATQFQKLKNPAKKIVILHPKSNGSGREWPLQNFAELISLLPHDKYQIFISGTGGAEKQILEEWMATLPARVESLIGKLTLAEFISFIKEADFLVASGTGPLHVAAVCNIGTIGLFPPIKPIHPGRWRPIGEKALVVCNNLECKTCIPSTCTCMSDIKAQEVASLILSM